MTTKTRNIIIITSAILILGAGTYLYLQRRKRTRLTKKSESEEGKEVKQFDDLVKNISAYIPDGSIRTGDSRTSKEGDKLAKKVWAYQYFATLDSKGEMKNRFVPYYYADGDFRLYLTIKVDKKDETIWIGSGKWLNDKGTKVFIEPKENKYVKVDKGTYEGVNIKDMLSKILKEPVGYYDDNTKKYIV